MIAREFLIKYVQGRIEKIHEGPPPMPLKERLVAGEPARNLLDNVFPLNSQKVSVSKPQTVAPVFKQ